MLGKVIPQPTTMTHEERLKLIMAPIQINVMKQSIAGGFRGKTVGTTPQVAEDYYQKVSDITEYRQKKAAMQRNRRNRIKNKKIQDELNGY